MKLTATFLPKQLQSSCRRFTERWTRVSTINKKYTCRNFTLHP